MNRILIDRQELSADGTVTWTDLRATHVCQVLHAQPGDSLKIGLLDGPIGTGVVLEAIPTSVRVAVEWTGESLKPWVDLILAVPRPKVLKRLWPQLAAMGVGRIVLLNASRVERHYFGAHCLEEEHYKPLLVEGLMQAGTTILPQVFLRRRFRVFMETELDSLLPSRWRLVAHPGVSTRATMPRDPSDRLVLAVGPEGGWSDFELEMLEKHGFSRFALGGRILRSDTACIALLAVLGHSIDSRDMANGDET